jgi:hypothetical protein
MGDELVEAANVYTPPQFDLDVPGAGP